MQYDKTGNINGQRGQTGGLEIKEVTADYEISELDGGKQLRVDGAVTITLPPDSPGEGFFCEVIRWGAGAVDFVGGAGVTVVSTAGATPAISDQYAGATITNEGANTYLVIGALA